MPPLMWSSLSGQLEIARLLISKGADVNAAKTTDGMTSLMASCKNGHLEVARLLLEKGANAGRACTNDGMAALHFASFYKRLPLVTLLLAKGADKNVRMFDGSTPLSVANTTAIKQALS